MGTSEKTAESNRILDAIRAKRERRTGHVGNIAELEASLIADIENFDLDEAERLARREQLASLGSGMSDASLAFPEIVTAGTVRSLEYRQGSDQGGQNPQGIINGSSLLGQLRHQAALRQGQLHSEVAERTAMDKVAVSRAVSAALKGTRCRNTITVIPSPTASSICGMRSGIDNAPTSSCRSGSSADTWGGRMGQRRMSEM